MNDTPQNVTLSLQVFEKVSENSVSGEIKTDCYLTGREEKVVEVNVPFSSSAHLWSHLDPFLYNLTAKLLKDATEKDKLDTTFGMRKFEVKDGNFYLNNEKIFLRGSSIAFHRFLSAKDRKDVPWDEDWIKEFLINLLIGGGGKK